jgi:hypothetical protein
MTTTPPKTIFIGEDLGMGANKLYGAAGGLQTLSQIAISTGRHLNMGSISGLRHKKRPVEITTQHGAYYVGENAHDYGRAVEYVDFERLTGTPDMLALFYGSLTQYTKAYGPFDDPLTLTVGLPISMMNGSEARNNAAAVKKWMMGQHTWQADGHEHTATVAEVRPLPQAIGALFDYVLDETGSFIKERSGLLNQEVGVVSIGFNTIELLVIRDRAPVENFTAGRTLGVRRLLELVNRDEAYTLGELDTLLRTGRLDYKDALPVWAREVTGEINRQWGRALPRFAHILFVGGGALLIREQISERFNGKVIIPDDPVLSIARGLYKVAAMKGK